MLQHKLLVIEPDEDVRRLLDESLTAAGYEVHLAPDVQQAMVVMRYYEPDAVLLAQEGEDKYPRMLPRVIPEPSEANWSFVTLCRLWRIPIIYMLESSDSPIKRTWDDSFFR